MNQAIEGFIRCRRIAVVGASRNPRKFGHAALKELAARGYDVVPVHPSAAIIAGIPCVHRLSALTEPVEAVLIVLPPEKGRRCSVKPPPPACETSGSSAAPNRPKSSPLPAISAWTPSRASAS